MSNHHRIPSLLASLCLMALAPLAVAESADGDSSEIGPDYIAVELADRGRPPGRRQGGSSRGNCAIPEQLTALVPVTEETVSGAPTNTYESVLSLTTQARPKFWFYVPYTLDSVTLEFVLQDANGITLDQTTLSGSNPDTGIVQISLSENAPPLEPNNRYQWYLTIECDSKASVFVQGWIDRVPLDPSLSGPLADASLQEQAAIYASNDVWQEAVTLLGELYQSDPSNQSVAEDWSRLLASVDLAELAEQPLVDCCTP